MAEKNRRFIFGLIIALVTTAIFYGCGTATSDRTPDIQYSITGTYNSQGLVGIVEASNRAVTGISEGILIYSEADPNNYAEVDTQNRTFQLNNLKPGTHYLVFKHQPYGVGGTTYIVRATKPVVLTETSPVQELNEKLVAAECSVAISGKVTNIQGQVVSPTPTLTLWGQTIEVNGLTGEFTTPLMPEGITADLVINAINYRQTNTPLEFNSNPAYYELSAVETTNNNIPPTVNVSSKQSVYNIKSLVTLTAVAIDANNDELEFSWNIDSCTSANKGYLEESQKTVKGNVYTSEWYWNAPEDDCLATISVTVKEKNTVQGLSAKASLKIQVGSGKYNPSSRPYFLDTSIYPTDFFGNRKYTITSIATDSDGDLLTQSLVIKATNPENADIGILSKTTATTWTWKTPDLSDPVEYVFYFEARDMRGNTATNSLDIAVNPTRANQKPVLREIIPSTAISVQSGKEATLVIKASDPENDKIEFNWINRKGKLKEAVNTHDSTTGFWIASVTWVAPYIKVATDTYINCLFNDEGSLTTQTATFTIHIEPDPDINPPEVAISITGTSDKYNDSILLFAPGEIVKFYGLATDTNHNRPIEQNHLIWHLVSPSGVDRQIAKGTSVATFTVTNSTEQGNYIVRLEAKDLSGISSDGQADFRINTPPVSKILYDGEVIGSDGRRANPTPYTHTVGTTYYDVYNINSTINLTASATDIESSVAFIENNCRWTRGSEISHGPIYESVLSTSGLNTVSLNTIDAKGVNSASSSYTFYVNTAPVFDVATTTKLSFINTDKVNINIKVTDDTANASMAYYISYRASEGDYCDYQLLNIEGIANPITTTTKNITSNNVSIPASTLANLGTGNNRDFRIRLIATDSMGLETVNDNIEFSIVQSHIIKYDENIDFVVASGAYDPNQYPYSFEELINADGPAEEPYIFAAKQKFSIRGGAIPTSWEDAMTWAWQDSYWDNGVQGKPSNISTTYVDGKTLKGYYINDKFGTHTITLTGKSTIYGITASNSVDVFINSVPKVSFNNKVNNTIRYDTGSNANFTITLEEDNKNEKLGLDWTIYCLDDNCEPYPDDVEDLTLRPKTYSSHKVPASGNLLPVDMAGSTKKTVNVKWSDIAGDEPLASGAKRIFVTAYDAYGASSTASVDILVNTLPKFNVMVADTQRKIKIEVPDDNGNGRSYAAFKNQYATATPDIPIYLISGEASMLLSFEVDATDAEDGPLSGKDITWSIPKTSGQAGAAIAETGSKIKARFGIGLNTINVEARDHHYGHYKGIYNDMCIATYSTTFYVWQSFAKDLPQVGHSYKAISLHKLGNDDSVFYVLYANNSGERVATFTERFSLDLSVNLDCNRLVPGYIKGEIPWEVTAGEYSPASGAYPAPIQTIVQRNNSELLMLTRSVEQSLPKNDGTASCTVKYADPYNDNTSEGTHFASKVYPYSIVKINNSGVPSYWYSSFYETAYPGNDTQFPARILSMTYTSSSDDAAGAMLVHNWKNTAGLDVIAAYQNKRMKIISETNSQLLENLDNAQLSFTNDSKIRFLNNLNSNINQKLFFTDTGNNRIIRMSSGFGEPNSIIATNPIDICTTNTSSKYIFSLRDGSAGVSDDDDALSLYAIDNASATLVTHFAKYYSGLSSNLDERAGKVKNPKSIIYATKQSGSDGFFGGLVILEEGSTTTNSRIQVIRSNKAHWLE